MKKTAEPVRLKPRGTHCWKKPGLLTNMVQARLDWLTNSIWNITDDNIVAGPEFSLITRNSDGQMLFQANMPRRMKHDTLLGSRIAEVHNGSSLFTGDAGQGESNIRRRIIAGDWLKSAAGDDENSDPERKD